MNSRALVRPSEWEKLGKHILKDFINGVARVQYIYSQTVLNFNTSYKISDVIKATNLPSQSIFLHL